MKVKKSIKIMQKFFKKDSWRGIQYDEKNHVFAGVVRTCSQLGTVNFFVHVTDDYASYHARLPIKAVEKNKTQFAEMFCRINFKMVFGSFQLDFNDGELVFEYNMPTEELHDDPMAKAYQLLYLPGEMLNVYGTALVGLVKGKGTPKELIEEAERKRSRSKADADGHDVPPEKDDGGGRETHTESDSLLRQQSEDVAFKPTEGKRVDMKPIEEDEDAVPVPVKDYTLEGLNIHGDFPLDKIVTAIRNFRALQEKGCDELPDRPRMNILLWGPPGTGKSEFVNYLGQQLGSKVVVKMASDILSHWVGKTEKAIREAFEEAEEEHAILFLDELDGLMAERSEADANWQVTQVNEILHCMERFNGIMIGATNLKENLDAAVLRRFTYKIEFDYLETSGKHIFFDRVFKTPLTDDESKRLEAIPNLAPGDFRTVSQQLYYLGTTGNAERLSALEEESGHKKTRRTVCVGFGAR